jgi:hypothetical protein
VIRGGTLTGKPLSQKHKTPEKMKRENSFVIFSFSRFRGFLRGFADRSAVSATLPSEDAQMVR